MFCLFTQTEKWCWKINPTLSCCAVALLGLLLTLPVHADEPARPTLTLAGNHQVVFHAPDGKAVLSLAELSLPWNPKHNATIDTLMQDANDPAVWHAACKITSKDQPTLPITVAVTFWLVDPKHIQITFDVTCDDTMSLDKEKKWLTGAMVGFRLIKGSSKREHQPLPVYERPVYHASAITLNKADYYYYDTPDHRVGYVIDKSNTSWSDNWGNQHCMPQRVDAQHYQYVMDLLITDKGKPVSLTPSVMRTGQTSFGIFNTQGQQVIGVTDLLLPWNPHTAIKLSDLTRDAQDAALYHATFTVNSKVTPAPPIQCTANIRVIDPEHVRVTYDLTAKDTYLTENEKWLTGAMLGLRPIKQSEPRQMAYLAHWTRHEYGGVPYELHDGTLYYYDQPDNRVGIYLNKSNANWSDANGNQNCYPDKIDDHHFQYVMDVMIKSPNTPPDVFSAIMHQRPVSVVLKTDKAYNWFEPADGQPLVTTTLTNAKQTPQTVTLNIVARDFDGNKVVDQQHPITLEAYASKQVTIKLPASDHAIYFVEASAQQTDVEVLDRTNVVILSPFTFKQDPKTSMFGIAAAWPMPSYEDSLRLIKRMGIRWTRNPINTNPALIPAWLHTNVHTNIHPAELEPKDPANIEKRLRDMLIKAETFHAYQLEFANEWNMRGGINKAQYASTYVHNYLSVLDRIRKETHSTVKITMMGLAGMDQGFLRKVYEEGGWDMFDVLNLHPGRGNYTVDYDPNDPGIVGEHGTYWNFYGAVRIIKKMARQYGEKPIILSETYAPTYPNSFWEDSYRNAAENVVLTNALAMAEGMQRVFWYQLNDSVWWARGMARNTDREFHFGLLNRDLSFKPSAIAYCNVAQALDQATFIKHLTFASDSNAKGLLYDTPHGNVAILWNRVDGYTLSKRAEHFASPEPWVDTWKTKVPMTFKATGKTVTTADAIGRKKTIPVTDNKVQLILDGAPLIVTGLQFE
jgi:hypothetical protein